MDQLMTQFGLMLIGAEVMLALMGLVITIVTPSGDQWSKRFFIRFFMVLVAYVACVMVDELIYRLPEAAHVTRQVWYLETLLPPIPVIMLAVYLVHCCRLSPRGNPLLIAVIALWVTLFAVMFVTPISVCFDYVVPQGYFVRGPFYPLLMAINTALSFIVLAGVVHWRHRLSARRYHAFLVSLIPITASAIIHYFADMLVLFGFALCICTFAMYYLILIDQNERDTRQQREIAHQRASITVLQMRPHFIYNTMMSIYYLCRQDPETAQQVTLDFTRYLRQNFSAIASEEPIPFAEELEHARAYLAVEQAQFEDSLFVHYDTPHVDFKVPPLTLQPLVENAVKHGMDPDGDPLHIYVTTRRTPAAHEVVVANTGADFGIPDDNEPHIALKNIRQRLEMTCQATLEICPREGGGTQVRVAIPA